MTMDLFLAVEAAIPADHPAAWLAVPLGIVFFIGSVYLLLWSSYGARKSAAITGVAWFGFSFIIGLFWWFGGPGIPAGLGISHLPGQANDHYQSGWHAFEEGSERAGYFPSVNNIAEFVSLEEYTGVAGQSEEEIQGNPGHADVAGSVSQGSDRMRDQFLPIDGNGVAQIGSERRTRFEEDAAASEPAGAAGRMTPFYTAVAVDDPYLIDDPTTGVRLARQEFQAVATFTDADGVPLEPVAVGESANWFSFYDPGQAWYPSALWTVSMFLLFVLSLVWLDRLEMREKRARTDEVTEAEDLAVPIAQ
ncbi:MAG: hypothetical protein WDZ26_00630 [Nitriliruptoraceae bacterium]